MVDVDLTICDREPLHLIGSVQTVGCLLAFSTDWMLVHVSDNCEKFTGLPPDRLLGQPAVEILTRDALHSVRTRLQWLQMAETPERLSAVDMFGNGVLYDVALHMSGELVVLEAEQCAHTDQVDTLNVVRSMTARLSQIKDMDGFLERAARQIRFVTDFDRVMVYKFLADGSGEVVAESTATDIESFLGLRYPASDIPAQARELYLRNLVRIIADVDDPGAKILSLETHRDTPLDLSFSALRTVSPVHIEYLRNMEVGASFSISIVIDEKLWGLFACHNMHPKKISFHRRTIAELFSQMFSLELASRTRADAYESEAKGRVLHDRIMASMPVEGSLFEKLSGHLEMLLDVIPCDGVALCMGGNCATAGRTGKLDEFKDLTEFLSGETPGEIFATDNLSSCYPPAEEFADRMAGILAVPVSRDPSDFLVFTRRELVQTVTWAGNPDKAVDNDSTQQRLSPRKSFEAWREITCCTSAPWADSDLRIAETVRTTLIEVILRRSEHSENLLKQAQEKQEVLIRELNHRVRNILSLIKAVVSQTGEFADDPKEFTIRLDHRVQALARAHDQLTEENWTASSLNTLIRNEMEAYLSDRNDRVKSQGPDVLLDPQAYTCLALVIHELFTNSAKYGALVDSGGRVDVDWSFDDTDALVIDWRETDGPPLSPLHAAVLVPPSLNDRFPTILEDMPKSTSRLRG